MHLSDAEIVARLRKGERRLYAALVERYRDKGFSLALRILQSREDAEEALQDAFVRAYNGLPGFQGASSFGTWFYRILYNVCMTAVKQKRGAVETVRFQEGFPEDVAEEPVQPGDFAGLELKDLAERVRVAAGQLPAKYAAMITMFYIQELSYAEIGEVTGLPAGTVKTHLFRGRLLLQKALLGELAAGSGGPGA